ncbi:3-isopropylmalate dehydrogenase [Rossellomorea marisflavi]|nr:3-isopropylmalate dehydrogenase [Rossellomorea marisflavi]
MSSFFIILICFFILVANFIGFLTYNKKRNLYSAAFTVFLLSVVFGGIGGVIALITIKDAFAVFYGLQVTYFLIINSAIILGFALLVTVIRKYNT